MGLLGDIGKAVGGIFKGVTGLLFGKPDKTRLIPPSQLIAPPSRQERELLNKLFPIAKQELELFQKLNPFPYTQTAQEQFSRRFNQTLLGLENIAKGELPSPFRDMIERHFTQELGKILNQTASRGIINSSVTQNAISNALQNTLSEKVRLLPVAQELTLQPFQFAVNTPLSMFEALRGVQKDYLSFPANMYSQMMSARYGVRAMPVVEKGSGGLLGAVLPGLATGLGFGLGSKLFGGKKNGSDS